MRWVGAEMASDEPVARSHHGPSEGDVAGYKLQGVVSAPRMSHDN